MRVSTSVATLITHTVRYAAFHLALLTSSAGFLKLDLASVVGALDRYVVGGAVKSWLAFLGFTH